MCLSVPAKLIEISLPELGNESELTAVGRVSIGGVVKEVSLAFVPEARVGDYVLIHVGFALSVIDEVEAQFVFDYLKSQNEEFAEKKAGMPL